MYYIKNKLLFFSFFFISCNNNGSYELLKYEHVSHNVTKFEKDSDLFEENQIVLFCFFSAQCPLSIKHVPRLINLKDKYSEELKINLIIPGYNNEELESLKKLDLNGLDVFFDTKFKLVKRLKAEVTPHYFIFLKEKKLYSGPFDNTYKSINILDNQSEYMNYVDDVIIKLIHGVQVEYKYIEPVGCYI